MRERNLIIFGLIGALGSAALLLFISVQIERSRNQISSTNSVYGVGMFNMTNQGALNIYRFTNALNTYRHSESQLERDENKKQYLAAFDILWANFVSLKQIDKLDSLDEVHELKQKSRQMLRDLDLVMKPEIDLSNRQISQIIEKFTELFMLNNKAGSIHMLRFSLLTDEVNEGIARLRGMSRLLVVAFGLSLGTILFLLWRLLNRERQQTKDLAVAHQQMTLLVDDLRSGQAEKRAKNQFLAAASHDLRQPLHALGLFLNSLEKSVVDKEGRDLLKKISSSTGALNGLFNGLLDISRLDAGVVDVNPEHLRLEDLFRDLETEYSEFPQRDAANLSIEYSELVVYSDSMLLLRILRNLVENSLLHAPGSSITVGATLQQGTLGSSKTDFEVEAELSALQSDDQEQYCEITISDTGPGIPLSQHELVFSEYYQLQNPERDRNKGLGLGLSIVKRLADLLGHKITLTSAGGTGTTFGLAMPLGDVALCTTTLNRAEDKRPVTLDGLTIVVIDDEEDIRSAMEVTLRSEGCTVVATECAESARQYLVETNLLPDIIIADYRLRDDKTGSEAVEVIREELNIDIPAFLITGDTSPTRVREASESGIRLLHKPVIPDELFAVISEITAQAKTATGIESSS